MRSIDEFMDHRHDFIESLQIALVDGVSKRDVVFEQHVIQVGFLLLELLNIGLKQVSLERIDLL